MMTRMATRLRRTIISAVIPLLAIACGSTKSQEVTRGQEAPRAESRPDTPEEEKPVVDEEPVKPPDDIPVQEPSDPGAVGAQMAEMKAGADSVIAEKVAQLGGAKSAEQLFRDGAERIFEVMWPAFGPANAWLFNERDGKLGSLCEKLGVDVDRCVAIIEELQAAEANK